MQFSVVSLCHGCDFVMRDIQFPTTMATVTAEPAEREAERHKSIGKIPRTALFAIRVAVPLIGVLHLQLHVLCNGVLKCFQASQFWRFNLFFAL
jgi:hypothetical protein